MPTQKTPDPTRKSLAPLEIDSKVHQALKIVAVQKGFPNLAAYRRELYKRVTSEITMEVPESMTL